MPKISDLSIKQLQEENARLLALISQQENAIVQQKLSIENLQHQLHLFRAVPFGRKSEKSVVNEQLVLQFDEAVMVLETEETKTESQI